MVIQTRNMHTEHDFIVMHVVQYSEASGVTLLECNPHMHPDQSFIYEGSSLFHPLVGAPLVVAVPELASPVNSPMGSKVELSVFPAYGCKLSTSRDQTMYDVRTWCGVSGAAILMYEGSVVGMHIRLLLLLKIKLVLPSYVLYVSSRIRCDATVLLYSTVKALALMKDGKVP